MVHLGRGALDQREARGSATAACALRRCGNCAASARSVRPNNARRATSIGPNVSVSTRVAPAGRPSVVGRNPCHRWRTLLLAEPVEPYHFAAALRFVRIRRWFRTGRRHGGKAGSRPGTGQSRRRRCGTPQLPGSAGAVSPVSTETGLEAHLERHRGVDEPLNCRERYAQALADAAERQSDLEAGHR